MYKLIAIFAYFVVCDACLPYNFEYGYRDNFTNTAGMCNGLSMWDLKTYSDIGLDPPHWLSEKFISPNRQRLSCVASFTFEGSERGRVDINAYMQSSEQDQITIMVNAVREIGDATFGSIMLGPTVTPNFYSGWHKLRIDIMEGSGNFTGYITMLGIADSNSIVLIDSFRYIPPDFEGECNFYDDTTTTPTIPQDTSSTPEDTPYTPKDDTPSTPEDTPSTPEDTPSTPDVTPSTHEDCPSTPEDTPSTPEDIPSTAENNPSTPEATLSTPEDTPSTPKDIPSTPDVIPSTPEDTPSTTEDIPPTPEVIPSTLENTPSTPEDTQSTPEDAPSTPDDTPTTPEFTPSTPEATPSTPEDDTPSTPEDTPSTPEDTPSSPEAIDININIDINIDINVDITFNTNKNIHT